MLIPKVARLLKPLTRWQGLLIGLHRMSDFITRESALVFSLVLRWRSVRHHHHHHRVNAMRRQGAIPLPSSLFTHYSSLFILPGTIRHFHEKMTSSTCITPNTGMLSPIPANKMRNEKMRKEKGERRKEKGE